MSSSTPVVKDEHYELRVPTIWRDTLSKIVARFAQGDYALAGGVPEARLIDADTSAVIAGNIAAYGKALIELPDATWESSVCSWQRGYWHVLVDLFTTGGASDLVLDVKVRENATATGTYGFEVFNVYVP